MGSVGCPLRRLPLAPSLSLELRRWRRTPALPEATFPARLASLLPAAPSCSWHVGVKPQVPGSPVRLAPPAIPRAPRRASLPEVKLRPAKRCGPLLSAAASQTPALRLSSASALSSEESAQLGCERGRGRGLAEHARRAMPEAVRANPALRSESSHLPQRGGWVSLARVARAQLSGTREPAVPGLPVAPPSRRGCCTPQRTGNLPSPQFMGDEQLRERTETKPFSARRR